MDGFVAMLAAAVFAVLALLWLATTILYWKGWRFAPTLTFAVAAFCGLSFTVVFATVPFFGYVIGYVLLMIGLITNAVIAMVVDGVPLRHSVLGSSKLEPVRSSRQSDGCGA